MHKYGIYKNGTDELICRNKNADIENGCVDTVEGRGGWDELGD